MWMLRLISWQKGYGTIVLLCLKRVASRYMTATNPSVKKPYDELIVLLLLCTSLKLSPRTRFPNWKKNQVMQK
ncbi:hypothetical protein V1523DRAFT_415877 [Lipomyces doorenjongii]